MNGISKKYGIKTGSEAPVELSSIYLYRSPFQEHPQKKP